MTDEDAARTAELLSQLQPGFLPRPIFEQVARLVALPIIEFIPLRLKDGKVEVLLIQRPDNDPFELFAGMVHTPGTVIRATDLTADGSHKVAIDRLLQGELLGTEVSEPHPVDSVFHASKRGVEQAQVYWIEVFGEPKVGTFYPSDNLPTNLIESQCKFIETAIASFKIAKNTT